MSVVDRRYGLGLFADNGCTYSFGDIVRRPTTRSERWTVIGSIADSAEPCAMYRKLMPEKVLHDLHLRGVVGGSGALTTC